MAFTRKVKIDLVELADIVLGKLRDKFFRHNIGIKHVLIIHLKTEGDIDFLKMILL
ncbi:hypothetical protein GCM10007028_21860 [Algibacter mikhailovii]|uniref:Uncharacterized protein n=1 Tax=Algibacter mikhailovii TaxID=425498 RepID=A0A918R5Y2_9FLAO|nr:hypothetical protein GCM10007028_21860 [Algibacter mikhailovii]